MKAGPDTTLEKQLLGWLKPVSRSFYLSIRFLPRRIRPTMATAYLLARASDTIADVTGLPADVRLEALRLFPGALRQNDAGFFKLVRECARHQRMHGEKVLLEDLPRILDAVHQLPERHRLLVEEVLQKILRGQSLDLVRFETTPGRVHALQKDDELDEYTYLVAGCVGEFWTKLCLLEWPRYGDLPAPELVSLGVRFGKGLQLINVLRDAGADLQHGRCYLPVTVAPDRLKTEPEAAGEVYRRWLSRALDQLAAAWTYTGHIRPRTIRFACALPALIGIRTLRRLTQAPPFAERVKVSRREVYALAALALAAAWWAPAHRRIYEREFGNG
ncbi:MAG: squalene/phytoene synthase family protein [Verrucomicrobia bacterium]|nr:squalene/phytoene synthase family protein [Verrucomicrobiota bacterium]